MKHFRVEMRALAAGLVLQCTQGAQGAQRGLLSLQTCLCCLSATCLPLLKVSLLTNQESDSDSLQKWMDFHLQRMRETTRGPAVSGRHPEGHFPNEPCLFAKSPKHTHTCSDSLAPQTHTDFQTLPTDHSILPLFSPVSPKALHWPPFPLSSLAYLCPTSLCLHFTLLRNSHP